MTPLSVPVEKPRKQPLQARSAATVDSILQATVQVLTRFGKEALTTTRVAARAGVSVGTLYQYFPNKRSLLQAVLRLHLTRVTEVFEATCLAQQGKPIVEMVHACAYAFFGAKMRKPKVSLALYAVSSDIDGARIADALRQRSVKAFQEALATVPETLCIDTALLAFTLQSTMIGISRIVLESRFPERDLEALREQMLRMLCTYASSVVRQPMLNP